MAIISIEQEQLRKDLPQIQPGDTVRVIQKIKDGDKERQSSFEGIIIARKHGNGLTATFTVRRVIGGIGVERIFPLHSPLTAKIEILRRAKTRRAKLYYIREKAAREVRKKMKSVFYEKPAESTETAETTA